MKKVGILSLIVYILYTLGGGALALYSKIGIDKVNANGGGWEGLGFAIILIVGILFGGYGLVATIFKLVHMATGWGFFGVICLLMDIALVSTFSIAFAETVSAEGLSDTSSLLIIPFVLVSMVSFVANLKSLRD